jgi:hypothetical protein
MTELQINYCRNDKGILIIIRITYCHYINNRNNFNNYRQLNNSSLLYNYLLFVCNVLIKITL